MENGVQKINNLESVLEIAEFILKIRDSDASWETKYDIVFSLSQEIVKLGWGFNYCTLDTTCEEDTIWYCNTLERQMVEWRKLINV